MSDLFFPSAYLPTGWAEAVRLSLSDDGSIVGVTTDASPDGCDVAGGVGVPGVPDLHSHAFQRAMAGLSERGASRGDTFWSWRERMYAFLERLDPDDVEAIAAQLYVELLRHGFTSVTEFHYLRNGPDGTPYADPTEMGRRIVAAASHTGIGLTLLPVVYRGSDFGGRAPTHGQLRFVAEIDALLNDVAEVHKSVANDPDKRVGLALHSLRAVPPDELELVVSAFTAMDTGGPIHIHVAEQEREVQACVAWSGARPVEWLLANVSVDDSWCAIHATHMTIEETLGLAASGAVVGLCPTTEANLGDGLFPFADFVAAGGAWGVGTDSHVSVSPVAELRLLEYGQRLARRERNVAAGQEERSTAVALLESAWSGGSHASGRASGALVAGARADVVVLDRDHPTLVGRSEDELLDAWIFSGEDTPVRHVMVGGRWVVRDGRHVSQDGVLAAYRAVSEALRS